MKDVLIPIGNALIEQDDYNSYAFKKLLVLRRKSLLYQEKWMLSS